MYDGLAGAEQLSVRQPSRGVIVFADSGGGLIVSASRKCSGTGSSTLTCHLGSPDYIAQVNGDRIEAGPPPPANPRCCSKVALAPTTSSPAAGLDHLDCGAGFDTADLDGVDLA